MLVAGQVEIDCVFGRIGCLHGSLHGGEPYRHIEIPIGTRWQDGDEFIIELEERVGVEMAKELVSPLSYDNPPSYVLHLPPDGELVAIWASRCLIHHAESWSFDYPDSEYEGKVYPRDVTGDCDGDDWWDEWFAAPGNLLYEGGIIIEDKEALGRDWDEDKAVEQYRALLNTVEDLQRGHTTYRENDSFSGQLRITSKMKQKMEDWLKDTIQKLQEDQFRLDIEIHSWSSYCSWCLRSHHDTPMYPTPGEVQLCEDCRTIYDQEREEMFKECNRMEVEEGRRYQHVLERGGFS